jgi:hypothetical protein
MEIKVTAVDGPVAQSKGKGNWQEYKVSYVDKMGRNKTQTIRSFEQQTFSDFAEISDGDFPVNVEVTVKKEGDFWNWKGAKVIGAATNDTPAKTNNTSSGSTVSKGNWETAEERAAKQKYIVRQSSITNAIALCGAGNPVDVILTVAKAFEDFVFSGEIPVAEKKAGRKAKDAIADPIS